MAQRFHRLLDGKGRVMIIDSWEHGETAVVCVMDVNNVNFADAMVAGLNSWDFKKRKFPPDEAPVVGNSDASMKLSNSLMEGNRVVISVGDFDYHGLAKNIRLEQRDPPMILGPLGGVSAGRPEMTMHIEFYVEGEREKKNGKERR